MCVAVASAIAASQIILYSTPNSTVASAVDVSYENETSNAHRNESSLLGEECRFVISSRLRGYDADTGILECSNPNHICVEDESSSLGGRCALVRMNHRELQTSNTPACTMKCTGFEACGGGTDISKIAGGSCCGYKACFGITDTTIAAGSCLGNKACYYASKGQSRSSCFI
jgi:hypothetical protein